MLRNEEGQKYFQESVDEKIPADVATVLKEKLSFREKIK